MEHAKHALRTIDVSGLPENVVRTIELLVADLRKQPEPEAFFTSYEAWSKALREWAASHQRLDSVADDSRESIYAGRGE